jgi:guanylate kinase
MSSNKVVIFSAPSGAGKTTIVRYLLEQGLPLEFSISACSRTPRANEVDGKDYHFLSPKAFKQKIAEEAFLEWEEVYDNMFYGTLKTEVDRIWANGQQVIFDVDVVGGLNIKKQFGEQALAVFVAPPSMDALRSRLENRGTETSESLEKRLSKAAEELAQQNAFDIVIVNDDLEVACQETLQKVNAFLNS